MQRCSLVQSAMICRLHDNSQQLHVPVLDFPNGGIIMSEPASRCDLIHLVARGRLTRLPSQDTSRHAPQPPPTPWQTHWRRVPLVNSSVMKLTLYVFWSSQES